MNQQEIDWYSLTAIKVYNLPEGWQYKVIDKTKGPAGYIWLEGYVSTTYKRGEKKGQPRRTSKQGLWIKQADIQQYQKEWETLTGKCSQCNGTGKLLQAISPDEEAYKECTACNATGKPQ